MTREEALRILGLKPNATLKQAKRAWRRMVKITHPDKNSSPDAAERFQMVETAYKIIVETEHRSQWEREQQVQQESERQRETQQHHSEQRANEEQVRQEGVHEDETQDGEVDGWINVWTVCVFVGAIAYMVMLFIVQQYDSMEAIGDFMGDYMYWVILIGAFILAPLGRVPWLWKTSKYNSSGFILRVVDTVFGFFRSALPIGLTFLIFSYFSGCSIGIILFDGSSNATSIAGVLMRVFFLIFAGIVIAGLFVGDEKNSG